ncbi:MAG TPA: MaoC/PaaZ C-terminal domain-containing protein [Steroidobacteraceae bacterium]|nr:MaoC/PaaZ C-terminal domain-containing protein [Steroidobacteraceae bacterium]HQZ80706.1 MaoC/PaaZ C-terminal domain-containing protein [Steroidobacteraceae bacterium]
MSTQSKFDSVRIGEQLPGLNVPITASLIVAGAIATSDYSLVHHDKAHAQAAGTPDIFMNILTSNGLVQRFVHDWAGPGARIRSLKMRLGAPNFPGDALQLSGTVTTREVIGKEKIVEVAVSGRNRLGEHVTATVRLALP